MIVPSVESLSDEDELTNSYINWFYGTVSADEERPTASQGSFTLTGNVL